MNLFEQRNPPGKRITQKNIAERVEVDFEEEEEHWNKYTLKDGTIPKVTLVLRAVKRLKRYRPGGLPIYMIDAQNIVRSLDVPEKLKAKAEESTFQPV